MAVTAVASHTSKRITLNHLRSWKWESYSYCNQKQRDEAWRILSRTREARTSAPYLAQDSVAEGGVYLEKAHSFDRVRVPNIGPFLSVHVNHEAQR